MATLLLIQRQTPEGDEDEVVVIAESDDPKDWQQWIDPGEKLADHAEIVGLRIVDWPTERELRWN